MNSRQMQILEVMRLGKKERTINAAPSPDILLIVRLAKESGIRRIQRQATKSIRYRPGSAPDYLV